MDTNYCYMRAVYREDDLKDIKAVKFVNDVNWKKRRVNDMEYRDPDYGCEKLYDDINALFYHSKLQKTCDPYDRGQIILMDGNTRLTSDYIGPSLTSMCWAGISNEEAWETLLQCRTIGGHLVWPRVRGGINPSKAASGGRGIGISDRVDVALYEIKNFLENKENEPVYNAKVKKSMSLETNKKWFNGLSFKEFCDKYFLTGSFVDEKYEIVWLADAKLGKVSTEVMRQYIQKNIVAIQRRNNVIANKIMNGKLKDNF